MPTRLLRALRRPLRAAYDQPVLCLALATLFWGGNVVLSRAVHADIPPMVMTTLRWAGCFVLLLPFTGRELWAQRRVLVERWVLFLMLGGTGMAAFHSLMYAAVHYTEALNVALMITLIPVIMVLAARLFLGERISPRQALGIALSLCGAVVLITRGSPAQVLSMRLNTGDLLMLGVGPAWAAYSLLLIRKPVGLSALAFLNACVLYGVIVMLPLMLVEHALGARMAVTPTTLAATTYFALCAGAISYIFWNRGVALIGAARASPFMHLVPLYAAVLAILLLGEVVRGYHAVGALLIGGGVYLATVRRLAWPRLSSAQRGPPRR